MDRPEKPEASAGAPGRPEITAGSEASPQLGMLLTPGVIPTSDGSNTFLHPVLRQTYHSLNGALQEARHVFLQNGLIRFLEQHGATKARVLEVGLGTGLNFLTSADYCIQQNVELQYIGIEPFPVAPASLAKSDYVRLFPGEPLWQPFQEWYPGAGAANSLEIGEKISLRLVRRPVLECDDLPPVDVVFFDAFAPGTQPDMWSREVITHSVSSLQSGGIFVSYSITGNLKRLFRSLGFLVEKPKGAAGKREMIRAIKS